MEGLEEWAAHRLALFLGMGEDDIRQLTLPHLLSLEPAELKQTLAANVMSFIDEFVQKRSAQCFSRMQNATIKLDYGKLAKQQNQRAAEQPPPSPQQPQTAPAKGKKGKGRGKQAMSLDDAANLERSGGANKKRAQCGCQAAKHDLFANCLSCGRIICVREGAGPCYHCNDPVMSRQQQLETHCAAFDPETLRKAVEFKTRLLEYDRNLSKRSVVREAKGDMAAIGSGGAGAKWLSAQEKQKMHRQEEALVEKIAGPITRMGKAYTVDLDLENMQVTASKQQQRTAPEDMLDDDGQVDDELDLDARPTDKPKASSEAFRNPWVEGQGLRPVYVQASKQMVTDEQQTQKNRKAPPRSQQPTAQQRANGKSRA
ncbi:Activating signal cointegrator 1 [Sorochytrium milnesiophthora]